MNKRARKLYDSITDLDEGYLLDAEEFEPKAGVRWKAWAGLAAAIVLAVGVGTGMPGFDLKSGSTDASAPTAGDAYFSSVNGSLEHVADSAAVPLRGGEMILLDSGESYVVLEELQEDDAAKRLNLDEGVYLELVDDLYVRREQPTEIALYSSDTEEIVLWDGEYYYKLQKQD